MKIGARYSSLIAVINVEIQQLKLGHCLERFICDSVLITMAHVQVLDGLEMMKSRISDCILKTTTHDKGNELTKMNESVVTDGVITAIANVKTRKMCH